MTDAEAVQRLTEALQFCIERLELNNIDGSEDEAIQAGRDALESLT